jgi:hypothetical protein
MLSERSVPAPLCQQKRQRLMAKQRSQRSRRSRHSQLFLAGNGWQCYLTTFQKVVGPTASPGGNLTPIPPSIECSQRSNVHPKTRHSPNPRAVKLHPCFQAPESNVRPVRLQPNASGGHSDAGGRFCNVTQSQATRQVEFPATFPILLSPKASLISTRKSTSGLPRSVATLSISQPLG